MDEYAIAPRRVFGMYAEVPSLTSYPQGMLTSKEVNAGCTVHMTMEIQNKSDDKIETALLQRKTFLLVCSENVPRPFIPSVLNEEEAKKEEDTYDRFLGDLSDGFGQPDASLGPAPSVEAKQYKIAIVQGGTAVDVYTLPENEQVLGVEVLYLTVEREVEVAISVPMMIGGKLVNITGQTEKQKVT
jgi:hypothetical protein